jgi:hypothetical protein
MLTTLWDSGKYKGFQKDPEKQIQWFIDHAGPLKARFGNLDHNAQNLGTWIADTERPAEQYRGRYALRFDEARAMIEKGKAAAGQMPAGAQPAAAAVTPGAPAAAVVDPSQAADVAPGSAVARPIDPTEFGLDGTGGGLTPEAEALLKNPKIHFDETGMADLKAGKIDPRVVAALTKLTDKHEITVSCMCSDHARATAGGNISNHSHGRGVDLATIDGEIVSPGSPAARMVATELSELDPMYRPNEIGSPFAIGQPGYFTDAAHQNHVHFGFKQEIDPNWKPPTDVAAGAGAPAAPVAAAAAVAPPVAAVPGAPVAAVAAVPGAPVAEAPPAGPKIATEDDFLRSADPATASRSAGGVAEPAADGQPQVATEDDFLRAPPAGPPAALAPNPAAVPAAVADAASATAAGGSPLGASALQVAQTQLGVREAGVNTGVEVDKFLAAAGVPPGNPWCASFVTWSLEQSGRKMEGGGWGAVATWVRTAEQGNQDLQIVSAQDARPGDLVAYDWGGQDDFGSDGHIGFLASNVQDGQFTALEGNNGDAVMKVPRHLEGANVKFIRVGGAAPISPPAGVAPVPGVPGAPAAAGVVPVPGVPGAPAAAGVVQQAVPGAGQAAPAVVDAGAGAAPVVDLSAVADGYPGDDAPKPQIAAWMAKEAEKRGLPRELPLMASLVESGMRNVHYGDADSVGFFQMRVGIWNRGDYAGYPEDPHLQVKWFLDQAAVVKQQRIAGGLPIDDPQQYGDWIADVERPAEQYRGRYQLKLAEATNLLKQAGGAPASPAPPVAEAAAAPVKPAAPDVPPPKEPTGKPGPAKTGAFLGVTAEAAAKKAGPAPVTANFLRAVTPEQVQAHAAGASPEELAAAAAGAPAAAAPAAGAIPAVDPSQVVPLRAAGKDATEAELARWMAKRAEEAGLPPELPVMAGVHDGVGFAEDPEAHVKEFIHEALTVKRQHIARGNTAFGKDPEAFGDWISVVGRSIEVAGDGDQLGLADARDLLT